MRLSRFFIDRPIFAAVLSIVVFIAGLLAMLTLPISEYPDVVPPSIVVRAIYPGANPRTLSEAVATPLEEQINGVENMLYMSSQATSDGVLTLTVTFRVGTDVDLAQVQVQNRVSQALPRLPEEVRQLGVTTVKSSPNFIMVVHLVSPDHRYDDVYLRNYGLLQIKDVIGRIPGRRPGPGVRRRRLRHAGLAGSREGGGARPDRQRRRQRHPRAERAGRGRRDRRPADARPGGLPAQRERARAAARREGVRRHHPQDRRRWRDHPAPGRGPPRARRRRLRAPLAAGQPGRGGHRHLPGARIERAAALVHRAEDDGGAQEELPRRRRVPDRLRPDDQRPGWHPRGGQDAVRGDPAGRDRRGAVPADLAGFDHPAGGGPDLDRRNVRNPARVRLLDQHAVAVRAGARHRHRGRRRDRRGGECRAQHRGRALAAGRLLQGDGGGQRPDHRHLPRPVRRVRAGRLPERPHGRVLPAVRPDDRVLDRDLGRQLAHPEPGPERDPAQVPRGAARPADPRARPHARLDLPTL